MWNCKDSVWTNKTHTIIAISYLCIWQVPCLASIWSERFFFTRNSRTSICSRIIDCAFPGRTRRFALRGTLVSSVQSRIGLGLLAYQDIYIHMNVKKHIPFGLNWIIYICVPLHMYMWIGCFSTNKHLRVRLVQEVFETRSHFTSIWALLDMAVGW